MNSLSIKQLSNHPLFTVESLIDAMIKDSVMGSARHDIEAVIVDYLYDKCRTEIEKKARDVGFMDQNDLNEMGYMTHSEWLEEIKNGTRFV